MPITRVGGIISLRVDGEIYHVSGSLSYALSGVKREAVLSTTGLVGFTEVPTVGYIEGEIIDSGELSLSDLIAIEGATLTLSLATGKEIVLREAYFAGENGVGKTEEGKISIRFEGIAEEV